MVIDKLFLIYLVIGSEQILLRCLLRGHGQLSCILTISEAGVGIIINVINKLIFLMGINDVPYNNAGSTQIQGVYKVNNFIHH